MGTEEYKKYSFSCPPRFLEEFDEKVKAVGMNRSEALRRGMRLVLTDIKRKGR